MKMLPNHGSGSSVIPWIVVYFGAHSMNLSYTQLRIRYTPAHYVWWVSCVVALKNYALVFWVEHKLWLHHTKKLLTLYSKAYSSLAASPVKQYLVTSHSEEHASDEQEYFRKSHHWNSVSAGVMRWNPQVCKDCIIPRNASIGCCC